MPCLYDGKDYFSKVQIPKVIIGNMLLLIKLVIYVKHMKKDKVCYWEV